MAAPHRLPGCCCRAAGRGAGMPAGGMAAEQPLRQGVLGVLLLLVATASPALAQSISAWHHNTHRPTHGPTACALHA